ncbi:hypothetical protein UlMin_026573 [Ulmus minor]
MKKSTKLALLFILSLFCGGPHSNITAQHTTVPVKVGVVVDYERWVGKLGLSCIEMALSDFYAFSGHNYKTRLLLHSRDSKNDVVEAAAAALDLIKNVQVQAILGPTTSMQANFMVNLGEKAQVPIISYSATSPSLNKKSSYFFRATKNQTSQLKVIASIVRGFEWRQVVPIYVDNAYGVGLIPFLIDALQEVDARVPYRSVIPQFATDDQLEKELHNLMTMQTRVFIVHTDTSLGSRIFAKAKEIGMMKKGYVWILTNVMTNLLSSMDSSVFQGILGIETYVPETKQLEEFRVRWKRNFEHDNNSKINDSDLNVFGLWAYDAAKALAIAIEKTWSNESFVFKNRNVSSNSTVDLETFGVSQNGPQICKTLSSVRFKGLAGDFSLVQGQLQSETFRIINIVNGQGEKGVVGFWTPQNGLVRDLKSRNSSSENSSAKANLGPVIWPGGSTSTPKGWEMIPRNGKKLQIGVPIKGGFNEFLAMTHDPNPHNPIFTGYCIDIFEAVMKALPYHIEYEYIPFRLPNGSSAGTYDDLVYQVYLGNFDAVVGDITIRYNRSLYVDFTLPYTESGVSMIVPVKEKSSKNAWVFVMPLTWALWATSGFFFIFIGFVVWVLEHRINEEFRGPISHQIGTSFWFSFSTMVFAHRENVFSNLSRLVVIVWIFVVLILTQSYTANLTSLLTVQQLQPTITDVNQLLRNGDKVGYLEASFVYGILKNLGFHESQLRMYKSPEELNAMFSEKKDNNCIAAAFDEMAYLKLFLKRYCSKYTMVDPTFKTDGFGFVFPKGSPLVQDISRAILNVTEGDNMKKIQNKWFGTQTSCAEPSTQLSSNSLGLESFWGLFLITGLSSLFALLIHAAIFFHGQRHIISSSNSDQATIWSRIRLIFRIHDQRDFSAHTFKETIAVIEPSEHRQGSNNSVHDVVETIANPSNMPSPSSYTSHSDQSDFASSPDEYGNLNDTTSTVELTFRYQEIPNTSDVIHEIN